MSFRVKLVLSSKNNIIPHQFKKIIFPVKSTIDHTIKDLKMTLKSFLFGIFPNLTFNEFDLSLENYLLHEDFETSMVLRENDEIE